MKERADTIIKNAGELVTVGGASRKPKKGAELNEISIIRDGALAIRDGIIIDIGKTGNILGKYQSHNIIDAAQKVVMPGFIDPHTHIVFAGSRHAEYESKISGKTYFDTHKRVGGINYTAKCTRQASTTELIEKALKTLDVCLLHGTTTIEIKSGYGLDRINELKILEVISELKKQHPITIVSTFLGAHIVPVEYKEKRVEYIELVKSLLPEIKDKGLAEFCDVFCDILGFSVAETRDILEYAKHCGLKLKLHAEQTGYTGGADLAAELGAISADHLDFICEPKKNMNSWNLTDEHIRNLAHSKTVGVLLPGVTFHLMEMIPGTVTTKGFLPASVAHLINGGVAIALATDYNPGSSRTPSMQAVMQLAARLYRMNYAQTLNAATINAAHALDRGKDIGSLEPNKCADIVIYDCEEHGMLIDNFGINMVDKVIKDGKIVVDNGRLADR
jgi:imidazolonepropionase